MRGHTHVVDSLLTHGADTNATDKVCRTLDSEWPFFDQHGDCESPLLPVLIVHSAVIHQLRFAYCRDFQSGKTALELAEDSGYTSIVDRIAGMSAFVDFIDTTCVSSTAPFIL
jgi:hypothetical protein